jgi:carboxyl-terminal processing protease
MPKLRLQRASVAFALAIVLLIALGVGSARQKNGTLFSPLYEIYQYLQNYFYWPEKIVDQEMLYGAIKGMVEQLNDPYSEFLDPKERELWEMGIEGELTGVGIEIGIRDDVLTVITPLAEMPAERAGILPGDRILSIDGDPTEGTTLTEASLKIRGEIGTTVVLLVRHKDGTEEEISIIRDLIIVEAVKSSLLADDRIGYIQIRRFDLDTTLELDQTLVSFDLTALDGFILDLRNNGGGRLEVAVSVSSRFVDEGVICTTKGRLAGEETYWSSGNVVPNLPLVVLINGGTASAAEITAGAIHDHGMGILIGERTFGKGAIQRLMPFADGSALKLTTGEYYTPSGHKVHEVGLEPDIALSEEDDPIEAAIAWLDAHVGEKMPLSLEIGATR